MKTLIISTIAGILTLPVFSQTARIQAIHNSADAAAEVVDVYLTTPEGSSLLIDDFTFRTASPFIDAPAGVDITVSIAPSNSEGIEDAIPGLAFDYNLSEGETYVLVAEGIVSAEGYNPPTAFGINVYDMGREAATSATNTDVLVHHGSTDAPCVDVYEKDAGELVNDACYGDFAGYLELPTTDYALQIRDDSGENILLAYDAPLATLELDGAALVVVASGFLDPSQNSDGPAFGLWVALPAGGALVELPTTDLTARVQAIHNSADAAAEVVDVYLTTPEGSSLLIDDFTFRTASPFIDAPANVEITLSIAPSNSTSIEDAIEGLAYTYTLEPYETYVLVAEGIVSAEGYNPPTAFGINVYDMGREAATSATNTDVLVHHGSTDAPCVDVYEKDAGELVNDACYGDFAGYLELPTADYALQIRDDSGENILLAYDAPLATLELDGAALVVVASGFLDPSQNSDGPAFGLWVALPAGGALVELPTTDLTARVQAIHNSADAAAEVVDVYLTTPEGSSLLIDDFTFRTASPFIDAPANVEITLSIAPSNSTSIEDAIEGLAYTYTLEPYETYVLVAEGIVSAEGYNPPTAFGINVYDMGREAATSATNTDVLVHHGSTDAPCVDIYEAVAGLLVDDACYGDFSDYLELPTDDYTIQVRDDMGSQTLLSYSAPLSTLELDGAALVVVASGFLDPGQNSNGANFGLWVALPAGGGLVELPLLVSVGEIDQIEIKAYPNPTSDILRFENVNLDDKEWIIYDMTGQQILYGFQALKDNQIDVSGLKKGLYHMVIMEEQGRVGNFKFIKI